MLTLSFANCVVHIDSDKQYLETVFDDGTKVPAIPQDDVEYKKRARKLGYVGPNATWYMCADHEIAHTILAEALGAMWSPSLYEVAHDRPGYVTDHQIWYEESLVLRFQKNANSPGVDDKKLQEIFGDRLRGIMEEFLLRTMRV